MDRIVLLYHFDASPAVLGDLINIRPLHQAKADVGVAQTVCRSQITVTVLLEAKFIENSI